MLISACQPPSTFQQATQASTDPLADLVYEILRGELSGYGGELPQAFDHYYQAALQTNDPEIAYRSVEIGLWMEDFARAERAAQRWKELLPEDPRPGRVLGSIYAAQGRVEESIAAYIQTVDMFRDVYGVDLDAVRNSLSIEAARPHRLEIFRALLKQYPEEPQAYLNLAYAAREAGQSEEALDAVDEVLKRSGDWPPVTMLKVEILRELGRDAEAVTILRRAVQKTGAGELLGMRRILVELLSKMGRAEEGMEALMPLVETEPRSPHWQMKRGTFSLELQDWDQAREAFEELRQNPHPLVRNEPASFNHSVASYFLGLLAEIDERPDQAIDYFYQVEERNYYGVDRYFRKARIRIGMLLWEAEQIDRARMHFRITRARSRDDENIVHLYIAEADLLYGIDQYQEGYDLLSEGLAHHPQDSLLLYSRALHAERLGRLDRVEADLGIVLASNPDDPRALNALGYTWVDHGVNLEQGLAYIQRAHEQLPDDAAILDSMGWAYYRLGDLERAEHYLRRAQNLLLEGEITAHLVEVLWQMGRREEAERLYRDAIKKSPDNEFLKRVARRFSL